MERERERNICAGRVFISYDTMIPPRINDNTIAVELASRDDFKNGDGPPSSSRSRHYLLKV